MGRKLVLTGTKLTDLTAPKLATIDAIMPEAGALLFLDPSHPYNPWPTFDLMSTSGTVYLPNLAYDQAKAMYPTGTTTTLGARYLKGVDMLNDGVASKIERTSKGGLHTLFSQTVGDTTKGGRTVQINAHDGINAYLNANTSHAFYGAFWGKITRGAKPFSSGAPMHSRGNNSNTFYNFYTRPSSTGDVIYPTATPPRAGLSHEGAINTNGAVNVPIFQDLAVTTAAGAGAITMAPLTMSPPASADGLNMGSMIFYGYYLEDLTVSGRTYAQVNALVKAKFDKDVKSVGGRYYGDTYTAPLA
jgi:hypothetical protein